MRAQRLIKLDAYERAEKEVCNTDCARFRMGTCIGNHLDKRNCYLFKGAYDYWVSELIEHECTADHGIHTCNECDDYSICPFV